MADLLAALALLWLGTVAAVGRDARARVANPAAAWAAAGLAALLPFGGAALWLCVRPPETLAERRLRRLALAVAELLAGPPPEPGAAAEERPDALPRRVPVLGVAAAD